MILIPRKKNKKIYRMIILIVRTSLNLNKCIFYLNANNN